MADINSVSAVVDSDFARLYALGLSLACVALQLKQSALRLSDTLWMAKHVVSRVGPAPALLFL